MDRNEATSSAMIQLVFGARRAVYSCKERTTEIRVWAAYRAAVSQGIIFALYFISVCLGGMTGEMQGQILLPTLHNINETASSLLFFLSISLTLSTVISSSASAVVSSSSVLACCSWLSRAWRAACRLLIWDSRSWSERVSSVTWRLISSFCSSCSSPIYKSREKDQDQEEEAIHPQRSQTHADITSVWEHYTWHMSDCLQLLGFTFCNIWLYNSKWDFYGPGKFKLQATMEINGVL